MALPREFVAALEVVAARAPEAVAIIDGDRHQTYSSVVAEMHRRTETLIGAGLGAGDRVALVAENSANFLISVFAVLKAGGVLATIYPSTASGELRACIDSADPVLVLVDDRTEQAVSSVLPRDLPWANISGELSVGPVRSGAAPNPEGLRAPPYLICYSSGTTDRPKAIMLSAENLYNGIDVYADVWHLAATDKTVVALPMAWLFGLATTSMATLLRGGTVIVLRRAWPEQFVWAIEQHRATFLAGVTTMFAKLVTHLDSVEVKPDLSSLRLCISGGEPRNEPVFDRWRQLSGLPVHDTFCASECFPLITYDPLADPEPVRGAAGKLVRGALLRVVDREGKDVVPGEVGEALVNGPGLFLGYWKDEEQTRAALTPDGWFRQKDLVRVDADGYVHVVGRVSDTIVRGGSKISPAEVEHVLRHHPTVHDVAVVGLPDQTYGQRVVAAIVLKPGHQLELPAIAAHARSELADYKVPAEYVVVDQLPQHPTTGKVDRRLLAARLAGTETRRT